MKRKKTEQQKKTVAKSEKNIEMRRSIKEQVT